MTARHEGYRSWSADDQQDAEEHWASAGRDRLYQHEEHERAAHGDEGGDECLFKPSLGC